MANKTTDIFDRQRQTQCHLVVAADPSPVRDQDHRGQRLARAGQDDVPPPGQRHLRARLAVTRQASTLRAHFRE